MENFIDSFFLSPSWIDVNASTSPSWVESNVSQTDSFLSDSIESYEGDGKSLMPIITSSHITGNVPAEGLSITHDNKSSIFTDGRLKHDVINQLFLGENLSQIQQPNDNSSHVIEVHEGSFSLPISVARSSAVSYDLESNASLPNSTLTISSSLEGNGSEPPAFGHSIGEVPYIPSVPTIWSPSHSVISSLPGQGKTQTKLSPNVVTFASGQQIKITSEISHPPNQGTMELPNLQLPSFYGGSQMSFSETIGMQDQQSEGIALKPQICHSSSTHPHMTYTNDTGCDVAAKPRVRARRGQATDPHSIAERLRREKIAERMKNLQELVPSSNKTDKASMLDEIIDYVKFLQLQVKVLSMSRLGAASAVVPPIIDVQEEDIESFLLSPIYQGVDEEQQPQDNLAFEREVVKLMDSNVTIAMQYLQNKGLCLMPIALATAISDQKDCTAAIPPDRRRPDASERNHQGDELNHINHIIVKQEHQVNR